MAAKVIRVSDDAGATWHTLPGSTGGASAEAEAINDTVFGQVYQSSEIGLITWGITANAFFKGYAGYLAKLLRPGTPTIMADEAMTNVSGKIYQVTDPTRRIIDRSQSIVVEDNNTPVAASNIEWIDYLFGQVKFIDAYSVSGPITITATYIPTTQLGKGQSYTLTMTKEAIDTTDFATAQSNNGYRTFGHGLRTVGLEIGGVFDASAGALAALLGRSELIIEIDPSGSGNSIARGFFKYSGDSVEGDVGALEEETLSFELNVPDDNKMYIPFGWAHTAATTLSQGVRKILDSWLNETALLVQYLPQGAPGQTPLDGKQGSVVVTDVSLSGGLSDMNTFVADMQGSGAITEV